MTKKTRSEYEQSVYKSIRNAPHLYHVDMRQVRRNFDLNVYKLKKMLIEYIDQLNNQAFREHREVVSLKTLKKASLDELFEAYFKAGGRLYVNPNINKDRLWSMCFADNTGVPLYNKDPLVFDED